MARRLVSLAVLLLTGGITCINSAEPSGFVFQYQLRAFGCDTDCTAPGDTAVTSAARGDTVWVRHDIVLIDAVHDTADATIRPACTENVAILSGNLTVRRFPSPATCQDSTARQEFVVDTVLTRFTRWIVDSALTPATTYAVLGRVMVQPRIEPVFGFLVQ